MCFHCYFDNNYNIMTAGPTTSLISVPAGVIKLNHKTVQARNEVFSVYASLVKSLQIFHRF